MWWVVVTTTTRGFVAKGVKQCDAYYVFQTPWRGHAPSHLLCVPTEWVEEIVPLLSVAPKRLPSEVVRLIGEYM